MDFIHMHKYLSIQPFVQMVQWSPAEALREIVF